MFFPRGEVVHRNLSTAFTDLAALLSALKTERFSGTVEIGFRGVEGLFFLDGGEAVHAEATLEAESKRLAGQEAAQTLFSLSDHKDGMIQVYRLSPERAALVAKNLQHEMIFRELSTNFTRLDKLLLKLREEKHTGFVEVMTKEHQALGVLFLEAGDPVDMFITSESGPSVFGRKSIPTFVENSIRQGAIVNVYRTLPKVRREKGPPEGTKPGETKPEERKPEEKKTEDRKPPEGARAAPEAKPRPPAPKPTRKGEELTELLAIVQEILASVEKVVDGGAKKGAFLKAFKRSSIEQSETFEFLDPFAGEFEYREGVIRFTGEASRTEFSHAIVESLRGVQLFLEKEYPKNKILPAKLRAEIESTLEIHRTALEQLGMMSVFSTLL